MQTAEVRGENIEVPTSFEKIKSLFPDEWVLIGNPEYDEKDVHIIAGVPLLHNKDKREASLIGRDIVKEKKYRFYTLAFTGTFKHRERYMTGIFRTIKNEKV